MPATPSVRIVKSFAFQDTVREWSNRYHFNGGQPADSTAWNALFDAITNVEKTCFNGAVTIVRAQGFAPGSDVPIASKSYSLGCTNGAAGSPTPGECAAILRCATTKRSTKNHPVFVFSYFHHAIKAVGDNSGDVLDSVQRTSLTTYAAGWRTGFTAGGITAIRCTPDGHPVTGELVDNYIGHRDFPR